MKTFYVGEKASLTKTATRESIDSYAAVSGDYNPIHMDEEYARGTIFRKCIAHGLFCLGIVSTIIGTILPGNGTALINEQIKYLAPVFIGDEITATVTISEINKDKNLMSLSFLCENQNGVTVLSGCCLVKMIA